MVAISHKKSNAVSKASKLFRVPRICFPEEGIRGSVENMCGGSDYSYILGEAKMESPEVDLLLLKEDARRDFSNRTCALPRVFTKA